MSAPRQNCKFCGEPKPLSKGHIWPESFGKILPSSAEYHEQRIGYFDTFQSEIPGPEKWERVGTGPLQKRRPRNTCIDCNSGWMSRLETATIPVIRQLILGQPVLLDFASRWILSGMLALVSNRVEMIAHGMKAIPDDERELLMLTLAPSANWQIWIGKHAGANLSDFLFRYTAMQIDSEQTTKRGPEYSNTQVTTLVAGQLYVHIFFSSNWPDFPGYDIELPRIWPISSDYIDTANLPPMSDKDGTQMHEAISRLGRHGSLKGRERIPVS